MSLGARCLPGSRRTASAVVLVPVVCVLSVAALAAHDRSTSYSRLVVDGKQVRIVFTLSPFDLHLGPVIDANQDEIISDDELDESIDAVYGAIKNHYHLRAPDEPSAITLERYDLVADNVLAMQVVYTFRREVTSLAVASTLPQITQPNHQHLLRVDRDGVIQQALLDFAQPVARLGGVGRASGWETVRSFVRLGVEHIFSGYDHLAFLTALLAGTSGLFALLKVITSFTVAHSLTLAFASFGLVTVPPRLVESLIALSIAYVAIENMCTRVAVSRWGITFVFGLVHGFGFSNVLRELGLPRGRLAISLFSFNAGVEVGQVVFVAAVFPALLLMRSSRWRSQLTTAVSLVTTALALYWFVQRTVLR